MALIDIAGEIDVALRVRLRLFVQHDNLWLHKVTAYCSRMNATFLELNMYLHWEKNICNRNYLEE